MSKIMKKGNVKLLIDKSYDNAVKAIKELNAPNFDKTDLRLKLIDIEMNLLCCQAFLQE